MLREWEKKHPGRVESIFNALGKVEPTHLLDRTLQDFAAVRATGRPEPDGDIAFDVDAVLEARRRRRGGGSAPTCPLALTPR